MQNLLLVAIGGALGASARHLVSGWMAPASGQWPWATFAINVSGSLLIGALIGWLALRGEAGVQWRLLLGTGVLGGFTTFSAYSLETVQLIERKADLPAAVYSLGSVAAGLAACFVGLWLARRVFG